MLVTGDGLQQATADGEQESRLVNVRFTVHFQEAKLGLDPASVAAPQSRNRQRRETMGHMIETLLMEAATPASEKKDTATSPPEKKDTATRMRERAKQISRLFQELDMHHTGRLDAETLTHLEHKSLVGQAEKQTQKLVTKAIQPEQDTASHDDFVSALGGLTATLTDAEFEV